MAELTRRGFLKLMGAAVTLSAGGIALLERESIRTYFLPPRGGWPGGSWELELANEALRILNAKLGLLEPGQTIATWGRRDADSLFARRARLVERVDKLARGWQPTRMVRFRGDGTQIVVHGGRSSG